MTTTICDQCGAEVGACGLEAEIREGYGTEGDVDVVRADLCSWECAAEWSTARIKAGASNGA